jgi:glycosyltransferase involved in cell wall biosynthesis
VEETWQVPQSTRLELREKRSTHCVVVPVINEGERIRRQLGKMRGVAEQIDLIIADGGSTDGSLETDLLRAAGVRALLTKRGPGRLSAQMRMAMAWALDEGYQGIVFIDGNDKDDPAAIASFVSALDEGVDLVLASRFVPGGRGVNTPLLRHLGIRFLHSPLISLAAGRRFTDSTNGFRAYSARLLRDPRVQPFRDVFESYELLFYLAIRAARLGFRIRELPVVRRYPAAGTMPTKISPWRGNLHQLRILARAVARGWNPPGPPA